MLYVGNITAVSPQYRFCSWNAKISCFYFSSSDSTVVWSHGCILSSASSASTVADKQQVLLLCRLQVSVLMAGLFALLSQWPAARSGVDQKVGNAHETLPQLLT